MANTGKSRAHTRPRTRRHSRKSSAPWAGWKKVAPKKGKARTKMMRDCGRKCFLGPKKSFPICNKGTCRVNPKGIYAAYVRSNQWGQKKSSYKGRSHPKMSRRTYQRVSQKAKNMLKRRGYKNVGKSKTMKKSARK
jgi:hypothetical protein